MERQQFYAVWLCFFAIAGSCSRICEAAPSDSEPPSEKNVPLMIRTIDHLFRRKQADEQERVHDKWRLRVARFTPSDDTNMGPAPDQMRAERIRAQAERDRLQRERDRLQREQRQRERTAADRLKVSSDLVQERIDRERGDAELWDRYNDARNKKSKRPSKKIVQH